MRLFTLLVCLLGLAATAPPSLAQSAQVESLEISDGGRDYLRTVGRRVDTNVAYYAPGSAAPELTTTETPVVEDRGPTEVPRFVIGAIAALILALVLFQAWRFGSPLSVSLRANTRDVVRVGPSRHGPEVPNDPTATAYRDILSIADKSAALVELARSALALAAGNNDLRWQSSWTARDLLRRLPREEGEALRPLVRLAEHVQFGQHSISEDEFKAHADQVKPLFRTVQP